MSSAHVREKIKDFITANAPTENLVDLTAQYGELKEFINEQELQPESPWLGIEFIGNDESPITIPATNDQGKYRETGAIYIHVVDVAKIGAGDSLLTRGETLRNLFRGARIEDIVIQSMTLMNFGQGATLEFDGGYMSGSFILDYERDLDL